MENILIIKLSALGDFIQATASFAAIRKHHQNASITLMTTKTYAEFAKKCPFFDVVIIDSRPKWFELKKWFRNAEIIKQYSIVYDLQTSNRSSKYFYLAKLIGFKGCWSGIAKTCSKPHNNPQRDLLHTLERQKEQLQMAGIKEIPNPDISWLKSDIAKFNLAKDYILMVAGGSKHRPQKRWQASQYAELAKIMVAKGITPVLIGSHSEEEEITTIVKECPNAVSLMGQTSFADIAELARGAKFAVGNDTGPMHLIACTKTPCLVLFSKDSDPKLCQPFGDVKILHKDDLRDLTLDEVTNFLKENFSFS